MSYTIEGWQHGKGFTTIDLTGLSCCLCHEDLGVIAQYQLTGMELYKCGEYNYSQMAHSWCVAFEELFEAWHEEYGYEWTWDERYASPAKLERMAQSKREREQAENKQANWERCKELGVKV